jgi:hypothetical protein
MNLEEILQIVEAVTKLVEALKGLGLDASGIKLQTSQPVDLLALFKQPS